MNDSELKQLLAETCPILPGQENRAWTALRDRLYQNGPGSSRWSWLYYPTWRGAAMGLLALGVLIVAGDLVAGHFQPVSFASASSESPGIYATSFYSSSAQAQVVWLNGLPPASEPKTAPPPSPGAAPKPKAAPNPGSL